MPLFTIGPRGYQQASAAATATFTPLVDRAAIVNRLLIDKVSAGDIWRIFTDGREVAAFDIQTFGNQQPLGGPYSGYPKSNDLFQIVRDILGEPLIYPVPQGTSMVIKSDGGATGNIDIEYTEVTPGEVSPAMMNHPRGTRFVGPIVGYRAAAITAAGEAAFDTQVAPSWWQNLFVDGSLGEGWTVNILYMFLEGGGRNTYNGSADHQSVTGYLAVYRNGQLLFTRAATGGVPLIGQASATGSANTVVGTDLTPHPPVQESDPYDWNIYDNPLVFNQGYMYRLRLNVAGDVTGGADYSRMRQVFLCDVRSPGA